MRRASLLLATALALNACAEDSDRTAPSNDVGTETAAFDAVVDTRDVDAEPIETATFDSGSIDAGPCESPSGPVAQIAAGTAQTCARMVDGTAKCWGSGYLGDGSTTKHFLPTSVPGLSGVVEIVVGDYDCARLADGTAMCWGRNDWGCLGDGTELRRLVPTSVSGLAGIAQISVGGLSSFRTCARLTDGSISCWGYLGLGDGSPSAKHLTPAAVKGLSGAVQLTAGYCARLSDGTAKCWNEDITAVPGLTGAAEIAFGSYHGCARLTDGTVKCWGANDVGQIGDGTTIERDTATTVPGLSGVAQIAVGWKHSCARLDNGTVKCWGGNFSGQLGDGTKTFGPHEMVTVPGLSCVAEIALGNGHSCARLADGTVECWGDNSFGQLGDGTNTNHYSPTVVSL